MSRGKCRYLGCTSFAIWTDVDTDEEFCGAHAVLVIDEDPSVEKRRDFADEYARDAEREAKAS